MRKRQGRDATLARKLEKPHNILAGNRMRRKLARAQKPCATAISQEERNGENSLDLVLLQQRRDDTRWYLRLCQRLHNLAHVSTRPAQHGDLRKGAPLL